MISPPPHSPLPGRQPAPPSPRWAPVRRLLRLAWHAVRPPRVRLVYDPAYERHTAGFPVDPLRADRILAFLANEGLARREAITAPRPAAMKNLLLVHSDEYVSSLQDPELLTRVMGTPVNEEELETILEVQRLMVGGTIHATRLALASGFVAVNLGGGFHHAEASGGTGFCVFNDLAVAIARLRRRGFHRRVLVVDLDLHDGNGTRSIFAADPSVHTFSIHNRHWGPTEALESTSISLGDNVGDEEYLGTLVKTLPPLVERFRPGLVIYVAGCDVAAGDHLGTWRLSGEAILARDRLVVELARGRAIPLAITLGGGYGDEAWRPTARLLGWMISGTILEPPDNEELTLVRFRQLKSQLDPLTFNHEGTGDGWQLTEEDLVGLLPGIPRQTRFLDYFSQVGLELLLERCGLLTLIRARGFQSPTIALDLDHPLGQTLRLFGDLEQQELLVELRLSRSRRMVVGREVLLVEWLLLQNPRDQFPAGRHPLPGQSHPGLGILREFFAWLMLMCETVGLDGIVFLPSHYHIAALSRRQARFLSPEHEALFRALESLLALLPLDEATEAVHGGRVLVEPEGRPFEWPAHPLAVPITDELRQVVRGQEYEEQVAQILADNPPCLRLAEAPPAPSGESGEPGSK